MLDAGLDMWAYDQTNVKRLIDCGILWHYDVNFSTGANRIQFFGAF